MHKSLYPRKPTTTPHSPSLSPKLPSHPSFCFGFIEILRVFFFPRIYLINSNAIDVCLCTSAGGQMSVVQALLEELPVQFLTYMRSRDIKPTGANDPWTVCLRSSAKYQSRWCRSLVVFHLGRENMHFSCTRRTCLGRLLLKTDQYCQQIRVSESFVLGLVNM